MTDKEIALVRSLSSIIAAIGAVHAECVAVRTEGISEEELLRQVDRASMALSETLDAFNTYVSAIQADTHA